MHAPSLRQELSRSSETCVCVCVSSLSLVHAVRFVHALSLTLVHAVRFVHALSLSRPRGPLRSHTLSLSLSLSLVHAVRFVHAVRILCVCILEHALLVPTVRFVHLQFCAYILLVVYIEFPLTPLSGSILSICFHHAGG